MCLRFLCGAVDEVVSDKYCIEDMNYKVLTKIGGLFALLHILLGIAYLALVIYTFPL